MSQAVETTELVETTSTIGLAEDIDRLREGKISVFSTVTGDDRNSRLKVAQAMSDSTPLDEYLNKDIDIVDFVIQQIELPSEETGELQEVPRIIIITKDGKNLHAISQGVFSSLKNITGIFGLPHEVEGMWPVKVTVSRDKTRKGWNVFTLKVKA